MTSRDNEYLENSIDLSDKSFVTSLGDEELIDFINRLSQKNSQPGVGHSSQLQKEASFLENSKKSSPVQNITDERENEIDIQSESLPSSPKITNSLDDSDVMKSLGSIPLAQPYESIQQLPSEQEPLLSLGEDLDLSQQDSDTQREDTNVIFGDYAAYFEVKSKHQQIEDEKYLEWDNNRLKAQGLDPKKERTEIFKNCIIHINGHTNPGISTLHKLIILNGGKFIHHLSSKGGATHVIASRLTPKKKLEFRNYKVVTADWIMDSISNGKLMKWSDYSLIDIDYGQTRLQLDNDMNKDTHQGELDRMDISDHSHENDMIEEDLISPLTQEQDKLPILEPQQIDISVDARHPDFLKIFFAKSRLHHLSMWKSNLRSEFLKLALEQSKHLKAKRSFNSDKHSHKLIVHIDFDCFFATASALKFPNIDFDKTPVCVSHGGNSKNSTADIASCNYVCREFGVRNGMWVRSARRLCPDLICLDYDFEAYERISKQLYDILISLKADSILPVSIDEALLDISSLVSSPENTLEVEELCSKVRNEIYEKTKCRVSIGVSHNVLLAKLCLRHAKPNGQLYLHSDIIQFLDKVNVKDLPGTGHVIEQKLKDYTELDTVTLEHLRSISLADLEKLFGIKTAKKLFEYSRGIDKTSISVADNPQEFLRKSVSIDINWGIRFDKMEQIDKFIFDVAKELVKRLDKIGMCTTQLVLKILQRAPDAPIDPPKFLGSGKCVSYSKSSRLGIPTADYNMLGTEARAMFRHIGCDPLELRGISLQAQKLISTDDIGNQKKLTFAKVPIDEISKRLSHAHNLKPETVITKQTQFDVPSDVDSSVLEALPSSIKKNIVLQREKNMMPVPEIPKEVDLEVFNALPEEIKAELKDELRRRNIKINPTTPKKDLKIYKQQLFPFNGDSQPAFVRVLSPRKSPQKKNNGRTSPQKRIVRSPSKSPYKIEKYDEAVLNELPSTIRDSIIKEWETHEAATHTEASKIREALNTLEKNETYVEDGSYLTLENFQQTNTPLTFQKEQRPNEIIQLIEKWIIHTMIKGPHIKDFELFTKYMTDLSTTNKVFYLNILENIQLLRREEDKFCDKWLEFFEEIDSLISHEY